MDTDTYKRLVRARLESGEATDEEWSEVLWAVLEASESLNMTPSLDKAIGAVLEDDKD
jgi:hypothetical protein